MTQDQLHKIQKQLFIDCEHLMLTKGQEYAHSEDALANFKRTGLEINLTPFQIWYVFVRKHWDAIIFYITRGKSLSTEGIRSRFLDLIVYAVLGYALIQESTEPFREVDGPYESK